MFRKVSSETLMDGACCLVAGSCITLCVLVVLHLLVCSCAVQVMLKQDSGEYACIAEDKARYDLGGWRGEKGGGRGWV